MLTGAELSASIDKLLALRKEIWQAFLDTFIITNKRQIKKSIMQLLYIHTDNECDTFHCARIQNRFA